MSTSKKPTIIILHGWGLKGSVYGKLIAILRKKDYKVFAPDLPGFASKSLVKDSMVLDDYVEFIHRFIEKNKLSKPILIGHSFGGRIAIKYVWRYPEDVSKIILTGVPVIRHQSLGKKLAYVAAIIGGKILRAFPIQVQDISRKVLYRSIGEWDYYKAGPLRQVFKNIIGEELIIYVKSIQIPVLLVWGGDDHITPFSDVEKIKKLIPYAQSIIVSNADHKLPYLKPQEFFAAVQSFL